MEIRGKLKYQGKVTWPCLNQVEADEISKLLNPQEKQRVVLDFIPPPAPQDGGPKGQVLVLRPVDLGIATVPEGGLTVKLVGVDDEFRVDLQGQRFVQIPSGG